MQTDQPGDDTSQTPAVGGTDESAEEEEEEAPEAPAAEGGDGSAAV